LKYESLNFLETSGPVQACNGIASTCWNPGDLSWPVMGLPQPPGTLRTCPGL